MCGVIFKVSDTRKFLRIVQNKFIQHYEQNLINSSLNPIHCSLIHYVKDKFSRMLELLFQKRILCLDGNQISKQDDDICLDIAGSSEHTKTDSPSVMSSGSVPRNVAACSSPVR